MLIRNASIEEDKIIASFDLTSLYTNIPIIDTLSIIKDYVNNDDQFTRKTAILQNMFFELVNPLGIRLIFCFTNKLMALQWEVQYLQHSRNLYAGPKSLGMIC